MLGIPRVFFYAFVCAILLNNIICASTLTQERVIIVTRHGIRVPFSPIVGKPTSIFSKNKTREWFADPKLWGADKIAALTKHGKEVIKQMGSHMAEVILPKVPYNFTVYADLDSTHRDIETAEAFMQGAYPSANFTVSDWGANHPYYMKRLMNQGNTSTPLCPVSGDLENVVLAEIGGNMTRLSIEQSVPIMQINDALDCCSNTVCSITNSTSSDRCTLMDIPSFWEGRKAYWEDIEGPLSVAAKLAEYIQLLYLNNMDWQRLVPSMTENQLANIMRLHEESMGIADDAWNARSAGSEMLVHITATFQQAVSKEEIPGLRSSPDDSLVFYAAHDINIYLLRRLLRLNWLTESFNPNESPPGMKCFFQFRI